MVRLRLRAFVLLGVVDCVLSGTDPAPGQDRGCNDSDALIFPGTVKLCDGLGND